QENTPADCENGNDVPNEATRMTEDAEVDRGMEEVNVEPLGAPPPTAAVPSAASGFLAPDAAPSTSPTPQPAPAPSHNAAAEAAALSWMRCVLQPAINRQGKTGWDLAAVLRSLQTEADATGDSTTAAAVAAVLERFKEVGSNYFRVHPKGVGLVCTRPGGLAAGTFVQEYLGEVHPPWRWFEIQDAVKKVTGSELPDFYNIMLERPGDDAAGYDVLFIDGASKATFASRVSHSCAPNCAASVVACTGRLTIALHTVREVKEGEELTFDYCSVTESERELREAICLCGSVHCRGSYLYYAGSRTFQTVMAARHHFLHRQVFVLRAALEPLAEADEARLKKHGLGTSALGDRAAGTRLPSWLVKWTALVCEYVEQEEVLLRADLLALPQGRYTPEAAASGA
ncbi:hypothetical protein H632_c3349p0, partial [Helicosporidium sp. ATCC 50920]